MDILRLASFHLDAGTIATDAAAANPPVSLARPARRRVGGE